MHVLSASVIGVEISNREKSKAARKLGYILDGSQMVKEFVHYFFGQKHLAFNLQKGRQDLT